MVRWKKSVNLIYISSIGNLVSTWGLKLVCQEYFLDRGAFSMNDICVLGCSIRCENKSWGM